VPRVSYLSADGERTTIHIDPGETVLDGALDNGIAGLLGQCGGGCLCATCHCYVEPVWAARLPAPDADELELLDYVPGRDARSRLACRITVTADLEGLEVRLPEAQL